MSDDDKPRWFVLQVGDEDIPGHQLSAFDCVYPDAPDGGADLVLPVQCQRHARSIYWCLNASVLYCDGGPPTWVTHIWPEA